MTEFQEGMGGEYLENLVAAGESDETKQFLAEQTVREYAGLNPFERFGHFAVSVQKRLRRDFDLVVVVTGEEGVGKSTLNITLAKLVDSRFGMARNVLFSPNLEKTEEMIYSLPNYSVVDADEAIKILYKRNYMTRANRFINQIYALCRAKNHLTLLAIPRMNLLDSGFREGRVKVWIHILGRRQYYRSAQGEKVEHPHAVAVMMVRDWSPFAKDVWWLDECQRTIERATQNIQISQQGLDVQLQAMMKVRTYVTWFAFEDLDDQTKAEYLTAKNIKIEPEDTLEGRERRWRASFLKLVSHLQNKGKPFKQMELADITGMSLSTINEAYRIAGFRPSDKE